MSAYRHIPTTGAVSVRLPVGLMTEAPEHGVRVAMPLNARTRGVVQAIVERLDGVAADWFWVPTTVDESGSELVLDYTLETARSAPFAAALPTFVKSPAIHLPELVELARYLDACARVLERVDVRAAIAPACLRYAPEREGAWRLMVVPLVDVSLGDWARSSADAWAWTPSRALLGMKAANIGAYAIGAALCTALTGELFPAWTSPGARFQRALRGWVGRPTRVVEAVRAALPASFTDESAALSALIIALLEPSPPSDWREQLAQLGEQLAPYRTAVRWEYEGKLDIARGILERLAATAPKHAVPWEVLARLRGKSDDADGALQAAIDALGTDEYAVRELAAVTRRIAHTIPPERHKAMIERAVAAIDAMGTRVGDSGRLHFAHIEARYLGRFPEAMGRLAKPAEQPWDNVLRDTLLARFHAARAEWAHCARVCKQARTATQAMPSAGGQLGQYLVAYLDYLDGIAHYGAVSVYSDPGYLADAFGRFVSSLEAAKLVCGDGDPLIEGTVDWLHALGELAQRLDVKEAVTIRTGISAYLGAQGLTHRISEQYRRETPPVVWYDAGRLLALSGAP